MKNKIHGSFTSETIASLKSVKDDFKKYVTHVGRHTCAEDGLQVILNFPNGFGASLAWVPGDFGTQGVELQPFRWRGDWWELIGLPFTFMSAARACELLMNIHNFDDRRLP